MYIVPTVHQISPQNLKVNTDFVWSLCFKLQTGLVTGYSTMARGLWTAVPNNPDLVPSDFHLLGLSTCLVRDLQQM